MGSLRRLVAPYLWLVLSLGSIGCAGSDTPEDPGSHSTPPSVPRIVSLVPSFNEFVVALGGTSALVARTDFDTHPQIAELASVGGGLDPDLERMVQLGVELVLTAEGDGPSALAARLSDLGIETRNLRTQTVEDAFATIQALGALVDRQAAADSLTQRLRTQFDGVRTRAAALDSVDVFYVVWGDPPMTTGGGTFIDQILTAAGGRNVFADAVMEWPTVGYESIVARDPDVVVWPRGEFTAENLSVLQERPGWRDVPAVREGSVLFVDGDLYNRPGPNMARAAEALLTGLRDIPSSSPPNATNSAVRP